MQKKFAFATVAVAGLATAASAQVRLSHNLEEFLVTAGAGIACAAPSGTAGPQTTTDNLWSRSFTLGDFGVTEGFNVDTVEFGIESLRLPTLIETEITVNLYQVPAGSAPLSGQPLLGSASLTTGDRALEVLTIDVDGDVDAGAALMVEVQSEDFLTLAGGQFGDVFFIGGNSFGQTAPSYVASPIGCAIVDPTDIADFGFPDAHFIIIAEGTEGGGSGCRADLDGDGSLTIFDFLTFQNLFDAGDPTADFDGDGALTIFDFLTFQNEFDAGC
jgi:hypothetical protein